MHMDADKDEDVCCERDNEKALEMSSESLLKVQLDFLFFFPLSQIFICPPRMFEFGLGLGLPKGSACLKLAVTF